MRDYESDEPQRPERQPSSSRQREAKCSPRRARQLLAYVCRVACTAAQAMASRDTQMYIQITGVRALARTFGRSGVECSWRVARRGRAPTHGRASSRDNGPTACSAGLGCGSSRKQLGGSSRKQLAAGSSRKRDSQRKGRKRDSQCKGCLRRRLRERGALLHDLLDIPLRRIPLSRLWMGSFD